MVLAGQPSGLVRSRGAVGELYLARAELRRAGDVSPLMLREANNQGINIPRSPKPHLNFDRLAPQAQRVHFIDAATPVLTMMRNRFA